MEPKYRNFWNFSDDSRTINNVRILTGVNTMWLYCDCVELQTINRQS